MLSSNVGLGCLINYCTGYTLKILFTVLAEITRHSVFLFAKTCNPNPGAFGRQGYVSSDSKCKHNTSGDTRESRKYFSIFCMCIYI